MNRKVGDIIISMATNERDLRGKYPIIIETISAHKQTIVNWTNLWTQLLQPDLIRQRVQKNLLAAKLSFAISFPRGRASGWMPRVDSQRSFSVLINFKLFRERNLSYLLFRESSKQYTSSTRHEFIISECYALVYNIPFHRCLNVKQITQIKTRQRSSASLHFCASRSINGINKCGCS